MFEKIKKFRKDEPQQQQTKIFDLRRLIKIEESKENKNFA